MQSGFIAGLVFEESGDRRARNRGVILIENALGEGRLY